jgi:hypothetical protein
MYGALYLRAPEVENESLPELPLRSIRSYRFFGRYALPTVQVGLEDRSSRERDGESARAPTATGTDTLIPAYESCDFTCQYLRSRGLPPRR